jgi:hypothetical protein
MTHDVPQRDHLNAPPKQLADLLSMSKGTKLARCELWTHALGWECRLLLGGRMVGHRGVPQRCRNPAVRSPGGKTALGPRGGSDQALQNYCFSCTGFGWVCESIAPNLRTIDSTMARRAREPGLINVSNLGIRFVRCRQTQK